MGLLLAAAAAAALAFAASPDPALIAEMRLRRVIGAGQAEWNSEEYTLLLRVREAQSLGAFSLLREKLATLKGFAARSRSGGEERLYLTVEGYRRWRFLKSQGARAYFESRGVAARDAFALRDMAGKPVFDDLGQLTQEGDELYNRVQRKLPALWKLEDGALGGNVRPPRAALKPAAPPSAPTAPASPPAPSASGERPRSGDGGPMAAAAPLDEESARRKVEVLKATGYVEITAQEKDLLLSAAKLSEEELARRSSLQIVAGASRTQYLLSPSDPLFSLVAQSRAVSSGQLIPGSR
ncbi:MAG: hypothetical protein AAB412_00415 [Elusimicrobiota bacterium]